jgi:hypothetical protein
MPMKRDEGGGLSAAPHRAARTASPGQRRRAWAILLVAFAVAHAIYFALGLRFDASPLDYYLQYLDPALLRTRLWESVFHLHSQPPLFNLFLGLVLKLSPAGFAGVFHFVYLLLGAAATLLLYELMRGLRVPAGLALALSIACCSSPAFVLHEHFLFYAFPLMFVLLLSAVLLRAFLEGGRAAYGLGFFICVAELCLVWGVFHLIYFLALIVLLWVIARERRRVMVMTAAIPLLLVVALYAKNAIVFGKFGASTWLGMNLWMVASDGMSRAQLAALRDEGRLSAVAVVGPFHALSDYPGDFAEVRGFERIPALRQTIKSTGHLNLNHLGYVAVGDAFTRDALRLIRIAPRRYAAGVAHAWFVYLEPASYFKHFGANAARIGAVIRVWDRVLYGKLEGALGFRGGTKSVWIVLAIGLPLVFVLSMWKALGPGAGRGLTETDRAMVIYLCYQIGFVAVVANLLQVGENNRFRFITDPLSLALVGFLARDLAGRSGGRRR